MLLIPYCIHHTIFHNTTSSSTSRRPQFRPQIDLQIHPQIDPQIEAPNRPQIDPQIDPPIDPPKTAQIAILAILAILALFGPSPDIPHFRPFLDPFSALSRPPSSDPSSRIPCYCPLISPHPSSGPQIPLSRDPSK